MSEAKPFEEYKEEIKDMSKENMIKGLYDLSKNIIEKSEEIERLNNRINKAIEYIEKGLYRVDGTYVIKILKGEE